MKEVIRKQEWTGSKRGRSGEKAKSETRSRIGDLRQKVKSQF